MFHVRVSRFNSNPFPDVTQRSNRLRTVRHVHVSENERQQEQERLQELIKSIAHDIEQCGADLNHYQTHTFAGK